MNIRETNSESSQGIDMLASRYAAQLHKTEHGISLELQIRLGYLPSRQQVVLSEVEIEIISKNGVVRLLKDLHDHPENQNPQQNLMIILPLNESEYGATVTIHQKTMSEVQKELLFTVPTEIWQSSNDIISGVSNYFGLLLMQSQSDEQLLQ